MDNVRDLLHFEAYLAVMLSDRLLIRDTTFLPTHHRRLTLNLPNSQFKGFERNRASNHARGADRPVPGPAKKKASPFPHIKSIHGSPHVSNPLMPCPSFRDGTKDTFTQTSTTNRLGRQQAHHTSARLVHCYKRERLERKRVWTRAHGGEGRPRRKRLAVAGCKNLFFGRVSLCKSAHALLGRPISLGSGLVWRVWVSLPAVESGK
jgi:hypothetical protein